MSHPDMPQGIPQPTCYEILNITPASLDSSQDPAQTLKRAYHRALLIHHPDKKSQATPASTSKTSITIDKISSAFATLSSPSRRSEYDNALLALKIAGSSGQQASGHFQTGIQDMDLDDLDYDDDKDEWYRSCRCGNPRGYRFDEIDLDHVADYGEVMVGCADCSLWLRVHFAVVDDDPSKEDGDKGAELENEAGVKEKGGRGDDA